MTFNPCEQNWTKRMSKRMSWSRGSLLEGKPEPKLLTPEEIILKQLQQDDFSIFGPSLIYTFIIVNCITYQKLDERMMVFDLIFDRLDERMT